MKKLYILMIMVILLIGCTAAQSEKNIIEKAIIEKVSLGMGGIYMQPICDDEVVCYIYISSKGGLSCFRDADLVLKYCGTQWLKNSTNTNSSNT